MAHKPISQDHDPNLRFAAEIAAARALHKSGARPSSILAEMRRRGVEGVLPLVMIGREVWGLSIATFKNAVGVDGEANLTDVDAFDRYVASEIEKRRSE